MCAENYLICLSSSLPLHRDIVTLNFTQQMFFSPLLRQGFTIVHELGFCSGRKWALICDELAIDQFCKLRQIARTFT